MLLQGFDALDPAAQLSLDRVVPTLEKFTFGGWRAVGAIQLLAGSPAR
jgi:hypothetical protein